jgi:hypothetical protein
MNLEPLKNITISVLGFGWLAQSLYDYWLGQGVLNKKTFFSRSAKGPAHQFELKANTTTLPHEIENAEVLIITLPPTRDVENYCSLITALGRQLSDQKRVFLIGTTSVFENNSRPCDEETPPLNHSSRAKLLLKAEEIFKQSFPQGLIIRSAGQIGPKRTPAKYLANKEQLPAGNVPVNVIHQEDLVRIISLAIIKNVKGILHAVSPHHPMKEDFYREQAEKLGFTLGTFPHTEESSKIIESKRLKELNYSFVNVKCDIS